MQLKENENLVELSLWIYFGEEYHYTSAETENIMIFFAEIDF